MLTACPIWAGSRPTNRAAMAPNSWNVGAPGGWPTMSLVEVAIYSPQSHQLPLRSAVETKTIVAMIHTNQPIRLFCKR